MSSAWTRRVVRAVVLVVLSGLVAIAPGAASAEPGALQPPTSGPLVSVYSLSRLPVMFRGSAPFLLDAMGSWPGSDEGAVLTSFDVRVSRTAMRSSRQAAWRRPARLQGLVITPDERRTGQVQARKRLRLRLARGEIMCMSARASDSAGYVGPWTDRICLTRFLDDRRLARHGAVRTVRDRSIWGGAASHLDRGGSLTLRRVPQGAGIVALWVRDSRHSSDPTVIDVVGTGPRGRVRLCALNSYVVRPQGHRQGGCTRPQKRRGPVRIASRSDHANLAFAGVAVLPAWLSDEPTGRVS